MSETTAATLAELLAVLRDAAEGWPTPNRYTDALDALAALLRSRDEEAAEARQGSGGESVSREARKVEPRVPTPAPSSTSPPGINWKDNCERVQRHLQTVVAERDAAVQEAGKLREGAEWRFVYANGASVSCSERVGHELARNATGHIEVRSAWHPLAAAEPEPWFTHNDNFAADQDER